MPGLKLQKIFRYDSLASRVYSENYQSEETNCGQLFILLELPKVDRLDQQPLIDDIINLSSGLFLSAKNEEPIILLEDIIKKINELLPDLSARSRQRNWLQTLDMAIGIIKDNNICFTNIGHLEAWLVSHNRLEQEAAKNEHINPAKIFSETINGTLEESDALIVSTSSLFDYLAKEKVRQLVRKYTATSAASKIGNLLQTVPDFVTFNSLIIKSPSDAEHELRNDELKINIDEEELKSNDIIETPAQKPSNQTHSRQIVDLRKNKKASPFNYLIKFFVLAAYYFVLVYKTIHFIIKEIKNALLFVFSKKYRQNQEEQAISHVKNKLYTRYGWWQNLSRLKKIAVIGLIATVLLFVQGVVYLTQKKAVEKKDQIYQEIIQTINSKFAEVDAKMIYNDEIAAEQILLDLQKTIIDFKTNKPEQQDEINKIKEKIIQELNKVRHIYEVPAPTEMASLQTIVAPSQIVQKNGKFYILGQEKLYLFDNKEIKSLFDFEGGTMLNDWPGKELLLISKQNQHFIFDLKSQQNKDLNLPIPDPKSSLADINIYGNNLYALDVGNNQIYKYPEQGQSFGSPLPWIKDDTNVSAGSKLAIDGSVYFVENNGNITKLTKGIRDNFNYHAPRPSIGPKSTIQTFKDSKYFYVIDPSNQRVIIFEKDGSIKNQYTSKAFDNLLDLAIDPEEKAIYLLNGQHLYLLAVEQ